MKSIKKYISNNSRKTNVYLLFGLPGSGKSTWCKTHHPELPVVSRDIIRAELGYTKDVDEKAKLEYWQENEVTKKEHEYIRQYLRQHQDFIIDDTNLKMKFRKPLIKMLRDNGAFVIGVKFYTPLETCIQRRNDQIHKDIMTQLASAMNTLEKTEVDKLIQIN